MAFSYSVYLGTRHLAPVFPKLVMPKNCFYLFPSCCEHLPSSPVLERGPPCLALLISENPPPNLYGPKAAKIAVFLCEKEPCHFGEGRREAAWLVGVCPSEPNGEKLHFYTGAGQK